MSPYVEQMRIAARSKSRTAGKQPRRETGGVVLSKTDVSIKQDPPNYADPADSAVP